MDNIKFGKFGEKIAQYYLIKSQYKILDFNVFLGFYEIDIIARDPIGTLVFIEVKAMRNFNTSRPMSLKPEDNFTGNKFKKIKNACLMYSSSNPQLVNESVGWRIDLITVSFDGRISRIRHYKNV